MNKKKIGLGDLGGIMYSTNSDFEFESSQEEVVAPENRHQDLRVMLDRKNRGGKAVTLVTGYIGSEQELQNLAKTLKTKCGVGGSAKNGEIMIQGDFRDKVLVMLQKEGFRVKKAGG